jgi:hypothetical protein
LIDTEKSFGVVDSEFDLEKRINFEFYELMYAWATGEKFLEVVKKTIGIDEGSIVKMVNSVERIC